MCGKLTLEQKKELLLELRDQHNMSYEDISNYFENKYNHTCSRQSLMRLYKRTKENRQMVVKTPKEVVCRLTAYGYTKAEIANIIKNVYNVEIKPKIVSQIINENKLKIELYKDKAIQYIQKNKNKSVKDIQRILNCCGHGIKEGEVIKLSKD